ncbi:MAG: cupredoxin domain-containing protein [Candidatus Limnocylindrales bacterium]
MTGRRSLGAILAAAALLLAACGSGTGGTTPPSSAVSGPPVASASADGGGAASECEVSTTATGTPAQIKGFAFPTGLSVQAGTAIAWTNGDGAAHTVTFTDGLCKSGQIAPGATVTIVYTVAGTYPFACSIHPSMTGTLEVKG